MNALFEEIFISRRIQSSTGKVVELRSNISRTLCDVFTETVGELRNPEVLETGMACGVSTVHLCDGIRRAGGGRMTSVDPNQNTDWGGIGVELVARAGHRDIFELIEEPSHVVLPLLVREGRRFDFIFIDGWHSFDYAFMDFFYADLLLNAGGLIAFHDCQYRSVSKVLRFIEGHKPYELKKAVALPRARTLAGSVARPVRNLIRAFHFTYSQECRIYRKRADHQVKWDFFAPF